MENEKEPNKTEILTDVDMSEHEKDYSEQGFWDKVQNYAAKAGSTLIYKALQLYYVAQSQECPTKVRAAIYSALGYFIRLNHFSCGMSNPRQVNGDSCR